MNLDRFKNDHVVILGAISDLRNLSQAGVVANAEKIAAMLITISGKIKTHLAAEDGFLYPALLKSQDIHVNKLAKKFQDDMQGIAQMYGAFSTRWCNGKMISSDPDGFRRAANDIFKALHERILRENTHLYPVAENLA